MTPQPKNDVSETSMKEALIYLVPDITGFGPTQETAMLTQKQRVGRYRFVKDLLTQVSGRPGSTAGLSGPEFVTWWVKHAAVRENAAVLLQICTTSWDMLIPWMANGLIPVLMAMAQGGHPNP